MSRLSTARPGEVRLGPARQGVARLGTDRNGGAPRMNPLRLEALNVARFERIDLDLIEGVTAIVGPNGAGKSTILNSIEAALFADGARDLAPMLSPDADRLQITLLFEHDGETYRVRRTYQSGTRGKATVDFERHVYSGANGPSDAPGGWETLTRETASATNDAICGLIGLSRRAFLASAFLSQGASGFFAEAPAGDRKKILGRGSASGPAQRRVPPTLSSSCCSAR
jgi:DNA repair exonuclease SbcCD ATPase subunit